jgi:cell division protein FtsZ
MEEERRFEEQKKALEERAERLRRLSFNVKSGEVNDDIEHVPAYLRRGQQSTTSEPQQDNDKTLSGTSVGYNHPQQGGTASVQTLNTFLEGKKPD